MLGSKSVALHSWHVMYLCVIKYIQTCSRKQRVGVGGGWYDS
jgi:hypothetical protein